MLPLVLVMRLRRISIRRFARPFSKGLLTWGRSHKSILILGINESAGILPLLPLDPSASLRMTGKEKPLEKQSAPYRYSPEHAHCLLRRPRFVILSVVEGSASTSPMPARCLLRQMRPDYRLPTTDYSRSSSRAKPKKKTGLSLTRSERPVFPSLARLR